MGSKRDMRENMGSKRDMRERIRIRRELCEREYGFEDKTRDPTCTPSVSTIEHSDDQFFDNIDSMPLETSREGWNA